MTKNIIIFGIFIFVVVFIVEFIKKNGGVTQKQDLSVYKRKAYLFDTNSEFHLYKILLELFGDKYFIFPQINCSHIIEPISKDWAQARKERSSIDRKSADFVMCDKEKIIPVLVIELDGSAHNLKQKKIRDKFIDELTKVVDLKILHITINNMDKEYVKNEINKKLGL